jgi:antitoxin component YwqK of YwqJK toxin-antitoxin module
MGQFKDNFPDAQHGKIYDDQGKIHYDGSLQSGKKEGLGKQYHPNGVLFYEGQFRYPPQYPPSNFD